MAIADVIEIVFPEAVPADSGRLADDLQQHLRDLDETGRITTSRASDDAMDLGSILVVVLGTTSVTVIARGLADRIKKRGDPAIKIRFGKDEITILSGLSADQKFELAKMALEKSK